VIKNIIFFFFFFFILFLRRKTRLDSFRRKARVLLPELFLHNLLYKFVYIYIYIYIYIKVVDSCSRDWFGMF